MTPTTTDVTALVLAGGRSRRFGRDKATFRMDGRRMVDCVVEAVEPLVGEVLVSVRGRDDLSIDRRLVVDRHPENGPLGGIESGLFDCTSPWLLVVACDMPFLTTASLRTLVEAAEGRTAVVASSSDGRLHPLCALYHHSIEPLVVRRVASSRLSMYDLLDELDVWPVTLADDALRNVNTPGDLS